MTRSFRRSLGISAALAFLVLGSPVDGAAADSHFDASSEQASGADPLTNSGLQRSAAVPVQPTGPPARSAARGIVNCGEVITKNTTLLRDVGPCPGNGIIIGADNIMLNLNGHTISGTPGPGDGNAAGIRLPNRSGVTVTGQPGNSGRTGTVTGFDAGVFINGGSGNTVENLVVRDNIGPDGAEEPVLGDGIVLFHSGNNRLLKNLVRHNGPYDGIGVLGVDSNDNLIEGNTVEDTVGSAGDFVIDGVGIIINNFLDEQGTPRRGEPIRNNHTIDNVVRRSDNSGISNIGNVGARVVGNTVQDNGQRGEHCNFFFGCQPVAMPGNGIGFQAGPLAPRATEALIEGNTVSGNTGNGIEVNTEQNRIVGNTALGNGGSDGRFDLLDTNFDPPCDANVWRDNVFGTAGPLCATGGLGSVEGPFGDATCSDGRDNDLNGHIDEGDFACTPVQEGPR